MAQAEAALDLGGLIPINRMCRLSKRGPGSGGEIRRRCLLQFAGKVRHGIEYQLRARQSAEQRQNER